MSRNGKIILIAVVVATIAIPVWLVFSIRQDIDETHDLLDDALRKTDSFNKANPPSRLDSIMKANPIDTTGGYKMPDEAVMPDSLKRQLNESGRVKH